MSSLASQAKREAKALRAIYQAQYKRALAQAKDMSRNETYRAACLSDAARIKRAYL